MHVLRKGYNQWSAGTPVDRSDNDVYTIGWEGQIIPAEFVVKRRNRTTVVPLINSRQRRKNKKLAMKALGINDA